MFLKVLEFPKLWNLILKTKAYEAKNFLATLVSEILATRISEKTFKISPETLPALSKIFEKFKDYYSEQLLNSPCPFSFYLFEENPQMSGTFPLRAGKIYFESSLKDKIKEILKKTSVFYKVTDWFDLGEVVFSVNIDPKIFFFFKDIFLTGTNSHICFFCHTNWHTSDRCPGLFSTEPWKNFDLLLNENLFQFPEKLWKTLKEKDTFPITQEWNLFFTRYFFLFPSFLKIVFYKFGELESWRELDLKLKVPVRGGDLGLSLEALETGKIKESEEKASQLEDKDFRKSLILAFCSLLSKMFDKTIYYLEDALEKVPTNFLKSYLLFLKGYIAYYQEDFFLAEELLNKALKVDPLCFPASYFSLLTRYQRDKKFPKVGHNFEHPWILTWIYLEPLLIKNQKEIESFLEITIFNKRESAVKRLKEGEDKFFDLKSVMEEAEIKKYSEKIDVLRKKIYEGGFNSLERAEKEALELTLELQAYIYNQIKKIQKTLKEIIKDYETFRTFWIKYPYKKEDAFFGTNLKEIGENINKIKETLKKRDISKVLKSILNLLEESKEKLNNLKISQEKLKSKWFFRNRLAYFLKVFLIGEGLLVSIYLVPLFLIPFNSITSFLSFSWFILFSFMILVISLISVKIKRDDEFLFMD